MTLLLCVSSGLSRMFLGKGMPHQCFSYIIWYSPPFQISPCTSIGKNENNLPQRLSAWSHKLQYNSSNYCVLRCIEEYYTHQITSCWPTLSKQNTGRGREGTDSCSVALQQTTFLLVMHGYGPPCRSATWACKGYWACKGVSNCMS
jgi:hypothetical protein